MRLRGYEPDIAFSGFGIDPGPLLESRVDERLASMQARGLVDEVRHLMPSMGRTARSAIGYREVADAFESGRARDEALRESRANTLKLARPAFATDIHDHAVMITLDEFAGGATRTDHP
jgi:tRNA A37 N6-isopentenylltransferase MiaA